jgi:hypothetical protein
MVSMTRAERCHASGTMLATPRLLLAAAAVAALAAPAPALAAWTAPTTVDAADDANPSAQSAFGGSVLTGWLRPVISISKRSGDGFAPVAPLTVADPFEKAWNAELDASGNAVVLTVRRHKPTQRIRATFVTAAGARSGPRTISAPSHSSTGPQLAVAADGTAVAAWDWHDRSGWRVQAAVRLPGRARFGAPQTLSPPAPGNARPWVHVAAGSGGRAALTWQVGGSFALPESQLHALTAGTDGAFGPDQALPGVSGLADVALAVDPSGAVQLAYLDEHYYGHEGSSSLHVAQGTAGAPLAAPAVLSSGGKGTSSGAQVATAFSADGSATVAWAKPGDRYEQGGTLEVFTRPGNGSFGPAQTLATGAQGVVAAGGPGASAVVGWMVENGVQHTPRCAVHAATRPQAGGPFGADETISAADSDALWPSVAMNAAGDAIAAWVTNDTGGGSGQAAAAVHHAD